MAARMNSQTDFDVLIIGARAAGASLGQLLAKQGRRVLLIDRDEFPSDTMSTHFMGPRHVELLHEFGVLEDLLAAGFQKVTRIRSWMGESHLESPAGPPGAYALTPRRNVLDQLLVDRAMGADAEFRARTRAEGLLEEDGRVVGAVIRSVGGESEEVRATVTVGADGKASKVAEWVGAEKYNQVPALRPAYYAYFQGLEPLPEPTVELFFGADQVGFVFPMRPGEHCIALEVQPGQFEEFRQDARKSLLARLGRLPQFEARLRRAEIEGKVLGTRGVENCFRKPFGPGWALTGDAGYVKDPVTGLGVGDALQAALMLAPALGATLDGADWMESMTGYQEARDALFTPLYQVTLTMARMADPSPAAMAWLEVLGSNPIAARMLLSHVPEAAAAVLPAGLAAGLGALADHYPVVRAGVTA